MRAVLQRVDHAAVSVDGEVVGSCGYGMLILLGINTEDTAEEADILCDKIAKLRIFSDNDGRLNLSLGDIDGEALVVSNFTLYANYTHGNRPDYLSSAGPDKAYPLYRRFVERLSGKLRHVGEGRFGEHMSIDMCANGPGTIVMDSELLRGGRKK